MKHLQLLLPTLLTIFLLHNAVSDSPLDRILHDLFPGRENELQPFRIYSSTNPNKAYRLNANLRGIVSSPGSYRAHSLIEANGSETVIFLNLEKFLHRLLSMKYSLWTNTLTMELMWTDDIVLTLDVKDNLKKLNAYGNTRKNDAEGLHLYDFSILYFLNLEPQSSKYSTDFFAPGMEIPSKFDANTILNVTMFYHHKRIIGASMGEANRAYQEALAQRNHKWNIAVAVVPQSAVGAFYFGAPDNDVIIFQSFKFMKGQEGSDVYILSPTPHAYVWIDNQATDDLLDTLRIDSGICKDLQVEKHMVNDQFIPRSEFDVVVTCEQYRSQSPIKVVLMNYLKDTSYRHLKITWDSLDYLILPEKWISLAGNDSNSFSLVRIIDLKSPENINEPAVIQANSSYSWALLVNNKTSEFEAHEGNLDAVLTVKSTNSSVIMDGYADADESTLEEWDKKFFVIVDDLSDDSPRILEFMEVEDLIVATYRNERNVN